MHIFNSISWLCEYCWKKFLCSSLVFWHTHGLMEFWVNLCPGMLVGDSVHCSTAFVSWVTNFDCRPLEVSRSQVTHRNQTSHDSRRTWTHTLSKHMGAQLCKLTLLHEGILKENAEWLKYFWLSVINTSKYSLGWLHKSYKLSKSHVMV